LGIVLNTLATIIQSSYAAYRGGKERERERSREIELKSEKVRIQ
jgi:hypothetical protein